MPSLLATAYCACTLCCGPNAAGLTAAGDKPKPNYTIAAPRHIPLGTRLSVSVPGLFTNRMYVVSDRLAKRYDNRLDIYMRSHQDAKQFGKRKAYYEIRNDRLQVQRASKIRSPASPTNKKVGSKPMRMRPARITPAK